VEKDPTKEKCILFRQAGGSISCVCTQCNLAKTN
jgi:hypothetical protein